MKKSLEVHCQGCAGKHEKDSPSDLQFSYNGSVICRQSVNEERKEWKLKRD